MKAFDMKALLAILALVFSSTAAAFPTQNGLCSGCHTTGNNTAGATISPETQSINLGLGETGLITFTVGSVPENSKIALFDLDTAGVTVGSPDDWFFDSGSANPYKSGATDDAVFTTASYSYDLTLTGDVLGTYDIQAMLVGGLPDSNSPWLDTASLQINVVPIPAAVWLFGSGLLGLLAIARRRRNS